MSHFTGAKKIIIRVILCIVALILLANPLFIYLFACSVCFEEISVRDTLDNVYINSNYENWQAIRIGDSRTIFVPDDTELDPMDDHYMLRNPKENLSALVFPLGNADLGKCFDLSSDALTSNCIIRYSPYNLYEVSIAETGAVIGYYLDYNSSSKPLSIVVKGEDSLEPAEAIWFSVNVAQKANRLMLLPPKNVNHVIEVENE